MSRVERGKQGEELAVGILEAEGLRILDRNWHCVDGELDIVAVEADEGESTLVFCEVKTRTGTGFGTPLEAITDLKVRRLRRLAARWIAEQRVTATHLRLDAIGILMPTGASPSWTHVKGIE